MECDIVKACWRRRDEESLVYVEVSQNRKHKKKKNRDNHSHYKVQKVEEDKPSHMPAFSYFLSKPRRFERNPF